MTEREEGIFASRLKAARELRGLTQEGLAKKIDSPPSLISHYESGSRKPSYDNLRDLCAALRVNSDYFLGLSKQPFDALRGGAFVVDPIYHISQKLTDDNRNLAADFLKLLVARQP